MGKRLYTEKNILSLKQQDTSSTAVATTIELEASIGIIAVRVGGYVLVAIAILLLIF